MTPTVAVRPVRLCLAALCAALAVLATTSPAQGSAEAWSSYLAPAGACPGAEDPGASPAVQRQAVACLVNWARRKDGRPLLSTPPKLQRAAALKGHRVVSCGQLSHTPCGSDLTASLRAAGYRYASFGENLWVGPWGEMGAREVVASWLQSPTHRENVLRPIFRHFGAALVRAPGLFGGTNAAVWVADFASPR